MKRLGRILLFSLLGLLAGLLLLAGGSYGFLQTGAGKAWLAAQIARAVSSPGMTVTLEGLAGAPPFDIRVSAIHGADRKGIWLEIQQLELGVDGAALLRGEVLVERLQLGAVHVKRLPVSEPAPASGSTSLDLSPPRLPVDVSIEDATIRSITLDPPVLGEPVRLTFQGRGGLAKGLASAHLDLSRVDETPGGIRLDLALEGRPTILDVKGQIDDPAGILAADLLRRSDRQPLVVRIAGQGPIADWHGHLEATLGPLFQLQGDIGIVSAATYRATIQAEARQDGLLPPEAAALIGDRLSLAAAIDYDGKQALKIENLHMAAALGEVSGQGSLDSATQRLEGRLHLALSDLRLLQAMLGENIAGRLDIDATLAGSVNEPRTTLDLQGHALRYTDIAVDRLAAGLELAMSEEGRRWHVRGKGNIAGLARTSEALPAAIGRDFDWSLAGSVEEPGPIIVLDAASIVGASAKLSGQGRWAPQDSSGELALDIAELNRFGDLAQLPGLAGGLHLGAKLSASRGGETHVELQGSTERLQTGISLVDALLGPDVSVAADLDRGPEGRLSASNVHLAGTGLLLTGEGRSDEAFLRPTGTVHVELSRLADLGPALRTQLQGRLTLDGQLTADATGTGLTVDAAGERLGAGRPLVQHVTAQARIPNFNFRTLDRFAGSLSATAFLSGPAKGVDVRLEASFARDAPDRINLPHLSLSAAGSRVLGNAAYSLSTGLASGNLQASLPDLTPWSALVGMPLKGSGEATIALAERQSQSAELKVEANNLSLGEGRERIAVRKLSLGAAGWNLLKTPLGHADLSLTEITDGELQLGHAGVKLDRTVGAGVTFAADATGAYNIPNAPADPKGLALALDLAGAWQMTGGVQQVSIDRLTAKLAGDSARLERPLRLAFGGGDARIQDLALNFAGGTVAGTGALEANRVSAELSVHALPLRPFGRLWGHPLTGTLDATATIDGPASAAAGRVILRGRGLRFFGLGETARQLPPLDIDLDLEPAGGRFGLKGQISIKGDALIEANGSLPLRLSARPLALSVPQTGELELHIAGTGKLEKLSQILPLGEDRIAGDYDLALAIKGTPALPQVSGKATITNASYLNQDYGTELRSLALELTGDQSRLELTRLSAHDSKSGQLTGSGSLDLAGSSPHLDFRAGLTNFLVANSDEAQAPVDAEIRARGEIGAPSIFGRITLRRSEFRIPDSLPPSIANLNVVEIDSRDPQRTARALASAKRRDKAPPALPLVLDIDITAPGQVFVRGHGLDSEWRGKITVTGDSATPVIKGQLTAVRGTFNVLGKDFVIRRGTIGFPTGSFDDAWVDLLTEYSASGITAQVRLSGSLAAPRLELSSTPQLPQDQILARVLFGTDAGHITPSQGLQLAFAAHALASGQPGMLDQLRSTFGLDRLGISSGENSNANGSVGNPTVSGGKYVAPGVYVGVEQGISAQSSRARVEVDLLPNVTGYSSVGADSSSRVGLDWHKDY